LAHAQPRSSLGDVLLRRSPLDPQLLDAAAAIADRLIARKQTVAVSESSAGGLVSAALLSVPGA